MNTARLNDQGMVDLNGFSNFSQTVFKILDICLLWGQ